MFFNEFPRKLLLLLTAFCISHLFGCAMQKSEEPTAGEHSKLASILASVRSAIAQGHLEDAQVTLRRIDEKLSEFETEQVVDVWLALAAAHREMGRISEASRAIRLVDFLQSKSKKSMPQILT